MNHRNIIFLLMICLFPFFSYADTDEIHTKSVIEKILNTKREIVENSKSKSSDKFIFLAFWDFDGTIIKGDCSEGMDEKGKQIYKGLAQMAIESGYSKIYPPKGGVKSFFDDYRHMEHIGKWLAYPFLPQMLRGAKQSDIYELSSKHFQTILHDYYFSSSLHMLKTLEDNSIQCHIISASSDIFLDGAAPTLGLDKNRFNGIEQQIKNGRLTEKLIYPVTWSYGKVEKLQTIVEKIKEQNPHKQVIVLAAFGNSYGTDGPFMKYVVTQKLQKGKPTAVMINAGDAPLEYKDLFIQVNQSQIVSGNK